MNNGFYVKVFKHGYLMMYIMFTPYLLQIKSFIGPQVNNIHINKNDYTITYIYIVAWELQDSLGCFHTSSPGSA